MFAEKNLDAAPAGSSEYNISLSAIIAAGTARDCTLVDIALFYGHEEEIKYILALRNTESLWRQSGLGPKLREQKRHHNRDKEEKVANLAIRAYRCNFRYLIYPTYNYLCLHRRPDSKRPCRHHTAKSERSCTSIRSERPDSLCLSAADSSCRRDLHWRFKPV